MYHCPVSEHIKMVNTYRTTLERYYGIVIYSCVWMSACASICCTISVDKPLLFLILSPHLLHYLTTYIPPIQAHLCTVINCILCYSI